MSPASANPFLRELFESHGVTCHEEDGWLRLGESGPRAQARFTHPPNSDTERTVQLDVTFEPWAGRFVVESFGGVGETPDEARREAVGNFARGTFHVLLAAFMRAPDAHVTVEQWSVGGIPRRVLMGDVLVRGEQTLEAEHRSWFDSLERALRALPLVPGTHWLRVYFAQMREQPMTLEVLLDNEEWPELSAALADAHWPKAPGFLSTRLFLVIQGGVDVSRAVASFAEPPGRDYDTIRSELRAHGASVLEAEKLAAYIPEAFCSVLVRRMGARFPDLAIFSDSDVPGRHEVPLAQDLLWLEAVRLAEQAFAGQTLTRQRLEAVMRRSGMLNALNQALNGGSQPADLVFAPLHIALSAEGLKELRSQSSASTPSQPEKVVPATSAGHSPPRDAPGAPRRPWWKVW
ncbi:DUF6348 family protein [Pyxidicoccus sp. 3LG]